MSVALNTGPADPATSSDSAQRLRSFIERIERLQEEIDGLNADKAECYSEAKGTGFDVKVMKAVVRMRRQDVEDRREQEELLDLYKRALGMLA
jgi:uncharacterized protein (UPF0335 family)